MIEIKDDSISLSNLQPQVLVALMNANDLYAEWGLPCVVTSGSEPGTRHGKTSLHYAGQAVDIRTKNLADVFSHLSPTRQAERAVSAIAEIVKKLNASLGIDYDVILESDHIHIEYQPKRRD